MIKKIRKIIFNSGLVILIGISFTYSNLVLFSIIAEAGIEIPMILIMVSYLFQVWISLLFITFAIELTQILFSWQPSKELKNKVRKKYAYFHGGQNNG